MVAQAYMALWFASYTPSSAWRTCVALLLGLAAPLGGVVAYLRSERGGRSTRGRILSAEWTVTTIGASLIVPTLVLVIVAGPFG